MVEIDNKKMWEAIEKLLDVADAIKVSLSKQGLQWNGKEIVSMEPKFKVGDWVAYCGKPYKITGLHNDTFTLTSCDGSYFFNNVKSTNEPVFHLWNIADAKDGDVLVASDCSIFLFAGVVDCACKYYVALTTCNDVKINKEVDGGYWETSRAVHPATKGQRDTLFKAMKEAGHVWLSDKKKPVKLLFKEGDTVRKKLDGSIWHINYINEHGYWGNHKPLFPIENQNDFELVEPELTPSEVTKGKSELTEFERFLNEVDVLHKAYMAYPAIYQVNDGKESVKGHYDLNFEYRQAYLTGYHQAKKDCAEHLNK